MLIFGDTFGSTMVVRGALHSYTVTLKLIAMQVYDTEPEAKEHTRNLDITQICYIGFRSGLEYCRKYESPRFQH